MNPQPPPDPVTVCQDALTHLAHSMALSLDAPPLPGETNVVVDGYSGGIKVNICLQKCLNRLEEWEAGSIPQDGYSDATRALAQSYHVTRAAVLDLSRRELSL